MKITKYVHACLLVQTPDHTAIIDPGQFSWESGLLNLDALDHLDDIIITHEHPDHLYLPFIQALTAKFPGVRITTTPDAAAQLQAAGIMGVTTQSSPGVELFTASHETMAPLADPPQNTGVHYQGLITHPGDSHHFDQSRPILALPVTAPWGTLNKAAALALELKPKHIIPIHDWHWNPTARQQSYARLETFFKNHGIQFHGLQDGITVEI